MVEYSNKLASENELSSNYSDEGYRFEDVYRDPDAMYQDMGKSGINRNSMDRLEDINKKAPTNNPKLVREKTLKRLFIQYVRKYISNPDKYLQYPKQIKNLPSWFDEALALFRETELSRTQKRMLREYFYGLIRYRDDKLAMVNEGGIVNPDEMNRQLGERSPYSANEDNLDLMQLPRQREVKNIDVNDLMKRNAEMNVQRPTQDQQFEEYGGIDPYAEPNVRYTSQKGSASLGQLGVRAVRPSNVEDYTAYGRKKPIVTPQPEARPHSKLGLVKSTKVSMSGMFTQPDVPTRGGMGTNLTSFIIGGNSKPSIAPPARQQPGYMNEYQQPRNPPAWLRKSKKPKVKVNRKVTPIIKKQKDVVSDMFKDLHSSLKTIKKNPLEDLRKLRGNNTIGKVDMNFGKKKDLNFKNIKKTDIRMRKTKSSSPKIDMNLGKLTKKSPKQLSGLETVRNMDKVFSQVRNVSNKNFGKENMKMKVVTDIKDQCNKAFANNKFKRESLNMKDNYFQDVKASYPQIRMEIKEMGNIRENDMMSRSMHDVPKIVNSRRTTSSLMVKRGSMMPESVGIAEYDFTIEPLRNRRKKTPPVEIFNENDYIDIDR